MARWWLLCGLFLAGCATPPAAVPRLWLDLHPLANNPELPVPAQIERVVDPRLGPAIRIERATTNLVANGDFLRRESDLWTYGVHAQWQVRGGVGDTPCLFMRHQGPASVALAGLKPGEPVAIRAEVRAAHGEATVELHWTGDPAPIATLRVGERWQTLHGVAWPERSSGAITFRAQGDIFLDNVQADAGVAFANRFTPPGETRPADRLPIATGALDPEHGTVALWVLVPWLAEVGDAAEPLGLFSAWHQLDGRQWEIMAWYATRQPRAPGELRAVWRDRQGLALDLAVPLEEIAGPANRWRHLALTWDRQGEEVTLRMYVDGREVAADSRIFEDFPRPHRIFLGHARDGYLNGLAARFVLYPQALAAEEVRYLARHPEYAYATPFGLYTPQQQR